MDLLTKIVPTLAGITPSPAARLLSGCLSLSFLLLAPLAHSGLLETLDNQKLDGNIALTGDGDISITTTNGQQKKIPLDKIRLARFAQVTETSKLPTGWKADCVGEAHGTCVEKNNSFSMQCSAGETPLRDPRDQNVFFVYHILRGNGEIVARLENCTGSADGVAGVLFRETLAPNAGFALLGVTPDKKLQFQVRESGYVTSRRQEHGTVTFPIWLRLVRHEKLVGAYRSSDGKTWQRIEQANMSSPGEPFPDGSNAWQSKLLAGLAVAGLSTNKINCSAGIDNVALTGRGLLATYYADDQFQNMRFSRLESKMNYWWGANSPWHEISAGRFSVRWLGELQPKQAGNYRFVLDTASSARLWFNGKELTGTPGKPGNSVKTTEEVPLAAGQKYPLKVEFKVSEGSAHMIFKWARGNSKGEDIDGTQFYYTYDAKSPDEYGEISRPNPFANKGIWLCNGSYLAGEIRAADDGMTRVNFSGTNELLILNSKIARVIFQRPGRPLPFELAADRTGLFLKNGDFFEGDFRSIKDRSLVVSSVLFGRRTFRTDNSDAAALVLNDFAPAPARYEIRLLDGSTLRSNAARSQGNAIVVTETMLGEMRLPAKDLVEIRRAPEAPMGARADRN